MGAAPSCYDRLMAAGRGDPFDRHVFACAVAAGLAEAPRPLTEALGLSADGLAGIFDAYFPETRALLENLRLTAPAESDEPEEPDLRALLLDHRTSGAPVEASVAAIVARRSCRANHLWQDMGLFNRSELSGLLHRHFHVGRTERQRHEVEEVLLS